MLQTLPFTIESLHNAYQGDVKAQDIVEEVFRRIDTVNDPGIFIHLFEKQEVIAAANALGDFDPSKSLWGIPFVIKDNIDAVDHPTTAGCPAFAYEAKENAFVVQALLDAGAILIGKTNLDQFATGLVGVRSPFTPPKNSMDPEIVPGGSSGGSGVAVGHGLVTFSLGTDTAGSGRVPAALNNIIGLKPTLGALSNTGVVPACRTLDTVSIFALTVEDAYQAYSVAAKFDPEDSYARVVQTPPLAAPAPSFKIGIPNASTREFFGDTVQQASFLDSVDQLASFGAEIVEMDFTPFYEVAKMLYEGAWTAERYTVIEDLLKSDPEAIHPVTRGIIQSAENFTSADTFRGFYRLQDYKSKAQPLIDSVDMLCVPSIPTFYSIKDLEEDPVGPNSRYGTYTNFVNLMDMCGIAVPVKTRSDGRPGSVTLLAPAGQDVVTASLASKLHQNSAPTLGATDWMLPEVSYEKPAAGPSEIVIAAVGAHMSGLPLNGELTKLGARFLYSSKTSPDYKLYKLAGGPPFRPGLIQEEGGASIELEIWALPKSNFGAFIDNIPSPLGIGTVTLANGEEVKGFICESKGKVGAEDITKFGGWRAFLNSQ
ncbi:allophanate hydrolase [Sneathiella sp. P13V-1]|uniref:allophanate hydrolase n=1 Tax=Sneathiella sp. P13V-1 TaxID=2697366 RepID=UPI00187B8E9C|nr:allophanate hydrolase [Sneathiella sp. P13V-1]MBE7635265.1 allophanate hydrolase [Sneathiella sp. P13V-1]